MTCATVYLSGIESSRNFTITPLAKLARLA